MSVPLQGTYLRPGVNGAEGGGREGGRRIRPAYTFSRSPLNTTNGAPQHGPCVSVPELDAAIRCTATCRQEVALRKESQVNDVGI